MLLSPGNNTHQPTAFHAYTQPAVFLLRYADTMLHAPKLWIVSKLHRTDIHHTRPANDSALDAAKSLSVQPVLVQAWQAQHSLRGTCLAWRTCLRSLQQVTALRSLAKQGCAAEDSALLLHRPLPLYETLPLQPPATLLLLAPGMQHALASVAAGVSFCCVLGADISS